MRIYCLTSIILIEDPPDNFIVPTPYVDNADENIFLRSEERKTLENLKLNTEFCDYYNLTEICIGYIENEEKKKIYVMNIYRADVGLLVIPMVRSMVQYKEISKNAIELFIPLREFYDDEIDRDIQILIRCIKNTSIRSFLSKEEETIYSNYAKIINEYDLIEDHDAAFDTHPFNLPNQSGDNVLRTKLRNLIAPRKGMLQKRAKNYHTCKHLIWNDVDMRDFNLEDINPESIIFTGIKLYVLPKILHLCFTDPEYPVLTTLVLKNCNLTELSDNFDKMLLSTLIDLDLSNNDITFITKNISKCLKLKKLALNNNRNLDHYEIPWDYLPENIIELELKETNIAVIPQNIKRLKQLEILNISSKNLKHISWTDISVTIKSLNIKGNDNDEINEIELSEKCDLSDLRISNAALKEFDCLKPPSELKRLFLVDNKIQVFDAKKLLPCLKELSLANNLLETIHWENLPENLENFYFVNNRIKWIGNVSHLKKLYEFVGIKNQIECISNEIGQLKKLITLELEENCISALPEDFRKLEKLQELNLGKNKFNFVEGNLEEVLWKRLPKNLKTLWISENNLYSLPCILKDVNLESLHVEDCKLNYICPFMYANPNRRYTFFLNIANNPGIFYLPFIPQTIFQPPSYNEKFVTQFLEETDFVLLKDLPQNEEALKKFIVTSNFPTKSKKPIYKFKHYNGKNEPFNCNCCGNCGKYTNNNLIEQLMVMDFPLQCFQSIQKNRTINTSKKKRAEESAVNNGVAESNAISLPSEMDNETFEDDHLEERHYKYYLPGKWKTNVITRICDECLKIINDKIDKAFDECIKNRNQSADQTNKQIDDNNDIPVQQEVPQMIQTDTYETENVTVLLQNFNILSETQQHAANFALYPNSTPHENSNYAFISQTENNSQQHYYYPSNEQQQYFYNQNSEIEAYCNFQPMNVDYQNDQFLLHPGQQNCFPLPENVPNSSFYENQFPYQNLQPNYFSTFSYTDQAQTTSYQYPQQQNFEMNENRGPTIVTEDATFNITPDSVNQNLGIAEENCYDEADDWFLDIMASEQQ